MSYQVIARKWRPQSFDEVTAQSHVTTPLRNAIRTGRVPHAILLTGPRGVGKTTLARILARCLNCEQGPTDTPCGQCSSCVEIAGGRSTDVQEVDAASRTGVDDVRELIEAIRYAPSPGKYRIFVVDEVHMLSTAAFNALLKTLEEPPPSSLFVFATTNPEKIPFTVISRCQRYDLRRIPTAQVAARLGAICEAEGVEISETSLVALAREGEGSMRDSQTLLDQVISFGGTEVDDETVSRVLDLVDRHVLLALLGACIDGDAAATLQACQRAVETGTDPRRLGDSLIRLLRDLVVLSIAPDAPDLVEGSEDEVAELRELAARSSEARLRRMFRAMLAEQRDLGWAPQPWAVLEMALIRLASMPPGDDVAHLLTRLDRLERRLGKAGSAGTGGGGRAPKQSARPAATDTPPGRSPRSGAGKRRAAPAPEAPSARPASARSRSHPRNESASVPNAGRTADAKRGNVGATQPAAATAPAESPKRSAPDSVPSPAPTAIDTGIDAAIDAGDATELIERLVEIGDRSLPGLSTSLEGARLIAQQADELAIAARGRFHCTRLRDHSRELDAACSELFGRPMHVRVELLEEAGAGVANRPEAGRSARERQRKLRQAALDHPSVNLAIELLDAEIVDIRPLGRNPA